MTGYPQIPGLSGWRQIAHGGVAVVWEACQQPMDRRVAVKVYERALPDVDHHRFLREASAAQRLSAHPGIVTIYSAGILPDDRPYFVMELCPGGSLTKWLEAESRPSEERVRQVGIQIADVLAAAHARGVLHRHIKPANILIDIDGNPRLAGFGLAIELGAEDETSDAATEAGDVFALAATLYALLAGKPPTDQPILPISGVSRQLMQVLLAALADDPTKRPSAAAFFGHLAKVPLRTPTPPTPAAQASTADVPPRRERRRLGLLVLAAALVIAIASATAWLISEPASSSAPAPVTQSPIVGGQSSSADPSPTSSPASSPSGQTQGPGDDGESASPVSKSIQWEYSAVSARTFEAAQLQGTYAGGANTLLRVQRWEQDAWRTFPVPTTTGEDGKFVAYVELGQPGRYRLRMLDPSSGTTSEPAVLTVKG